MNFLSKYDPLFHLQKELSYLQNFYNMILYTPETTHIFHIAFYRFFRH